MTCLTLREYLNLMNYTKKIVENLGERILNGILNVKRVTDGKVKNNTKRKKIRFNK